MDVKAATLAITFFLIQSIQSNYLANGGALQKPHHRRAISNLFHQREMKVDDSTLFLKDDIINKAALRDKNRLWPNATVFYVISKTFPRRNRRLIMEAMQDIETHTCVRFVPRTDEKNYINITHTGEGCYSTVGMAGGGQIVSLDRPGCLRFKVTAIHELMHVLGFFHEHARYDRDRHVVVNLHNVLPEEQINLKKLDKEFITQLGVGYDTESALHYESDDFAIEGKGPSIVGRDGTLQFSNYEGLTEKDILKVNRLYGCDADDICWDDDPIGCRHLIERHGQGHCQDDREFMERDCRETCGFCMIDKKQIDNNKEAAECNDDDENLCGILSVVCGISETFSKVCRKSCGLCH